MANPNPSGPFGAQAAKPSSGKRSSSSGRKTYREAYKDADKSKYSTFEAFEKAAKAYNAKKASKSSANTTKSSEQNKSANTKPSTVATESESKQNQKKKDNMTTGVIAPTPSKTESKPSEKTSPRTVKQVRQEAKAERKSIRKENREKRQAPRKARRLANVEARQDRKTARVEKRQEKRTANAAKRETKRANRNKIETSSMAKGPNTSVSNNTSGRVKSQFGLANAEAKIKKGNELLANQRLESDLNKTAFMMKSETPMKMMQNQQGVQGTPYQAANQMNYNFDPLAQQRAQQMQMPPVNNSPFNITEKQKTLPKQIQEAILAKEKKQK